MDGEHMAFDSTETAALHAAIEGALESGKLIRALVLLIENISGFPDSPELLRYAARIHGLAGDTETAVRIFQRLADHGARTNRPLDALIALKYLNELDQPTDDRVHQIADLFARTSSLLRPGTAPELPSPIVPPALPDDNTGDHDLDALLERARDLADQFTRRDSGHEIHCSPLPLLSDLEPAEFRAVVGRMRRRALTPGDPVAVASTRTLGLTWVAGGNFAVERDGQPRTTVSGPHLLFGLELLQGRTADQTVRCLDVCDVLFLDALDLRDLLRSHPPLRDALIRVVRRYEVHGALARCPLWQQLPVDAQGSLLARFKAYRLTEGQELVRRGEPSPGLYVITAGRVRFQAATDGDAQALGRGDVVGLVGLDADEVAPLSAVCENETHVLFVPGEQLRTFLEQSPAAAEAVDRLRRSVER
jgi:CRP-like cAMP-binding protein